MRELMGLKEMSSFMRSVNLSPNAGGIEDEMALRDRFSTFSPGKLARIPSNLPAIRFLAKSSTFRFVSCCIDLGMPSL